MTSLLNFFGTYQSLFLSTAVCLAAAVILFKYRQLKKKYQELQKSPNTFSHQAEADSKYSSLKLICKNMPCGLAEYELVFNERNEAIDFRIIQLNQAFTSFTGIETQNLGQLSKQLYPEYTDSDIQLYLEVPRTGKMEITEYHNNTHVKCYQVYAFHSGENRFATLLTDISEAKKLEHALQLERGQFKALFEHAPIAALIIDETHILNCNDNALELFEYEDKEQLANTLHEHLHPELQPDDSPVTLLSSVSQEANTPLEMVMYRQSGQVFPAVVNLTRTAFDGRKIYLAIIQDQSERTRIENELRSNEERLTSAFTASKLGLWDWNLDTGGLFVNDSWLNMLGYSPNDTFEKTGDNAFNLIHPDDISTVKKNVEANKTGQLDYYQAHFRMRCKNGSYKWLHASGQVKERSNQGKATRMIGIHMDISETITLQEDLRKAKDEAEAADQAKSDFLANMSHEIRTPLNAIIGMGYLMEKTGLTHKQSEYLRKMQTSANLLFETINDILDFSKISADALTLENTEFMLEDILRDVGDVNSDNARSKGVEMLYSFPHATIPPLIGDPLRLSQILNNLISNAIKFTSQGAVVLSYEIMAQTPSVVTINFSVKDTGIGLSQEQQKKLFTAFTQADGSTTRKFGGTGLGLSICKQLVTMMKSDIKVESELGEGARFSFTIKFKTGKQNINRAEQTSDLASLHVLIVDDSPEVARILQKLLRKQVQKTSHALTAEKCMTLIENKDNPVDLVLLDRQLPNSDGLEVCKWIKNHTGLAKIPLVIICSGLVEDTSVLSTSKPIYDGYLQKPFTRSTIYTTIQNALKPQKKTLTKTAAAKSSIDLSEDLKKIVHSKILLVEDNELNQEVASRILTDAGFDVTIAEDGKQALKQAYENPFDLVLMDIQMPVMDGYEATRILRSNPQFIKLPILAMTANATERDLKLSALTGMNEHLSKPIVPEVLFAALIRWISPKKGKKGSKTAQSNSGQDIHIPDITGLDIEKGLIRVAGNKELYRKTIKRFAEKYQGAAQEIEQLLQEDKREDASRLAHSIKGISGMVGAGIVYNLTQELENEIKNNGENIEKQLKGLDRTIQPLCSTIIEKLN